MKCSAQFSSDRRYRYQLVREWQPDCQRLIWMMLNPSRADENRDDMTVKKCVTFSINWGYGGIEVYNFFAFKATYPYSLMTAPASEQGEGHK